MKPILKIEKDEKQVKQEQRQSKLTTLADKKAKGKLTLEDIYEQNQIIIEMLYEMAQK